MPEQTFSSLLSVECFPFFAQVGVLDDGFLHWPGIFDLLLRIPAFPWIFSVTFWVFYLFSMDMQQFESFRRVDVYAFALVMWETTTRFSLIGHNSLSREECVVQSCHNAKRQFWLDSIKLVYYSLPWRVLPRSIDGGHMTIDVWQTSFFGISLMWASGVNDWISKFFALLIGWFDIKKVIRFF